MATLYRKRENGLSELLNAVSKVFDHKCPWCKSPLELVSLSEIGVKNLSTNGLIRCTNESCEYYAYAMPTPEEEKAFKDRGELPGWATSACEIRSIEELRKES